MPHSREPMQAFIEDAPLYRWIEIDAPRRISELIAQASARFCSDLDGERSQCRREPAGTACAHVEQAREPLGEGAPRTTGLGAVEAPHYDLQANPAPERGEIRWATGVLAVRSTTEGVACRAARLVACGADANDRAACRLSQNSLHDAAGYGIHLLHPG